MSSQSVQQSKPVPTTKQELISMLKEQLQKVQDEISDMQNTLVNQKEKRKDLTGQLEEKQKKIQVLLQNQSKTLGDKVNEELYNTLQAANKMRAQAQAQKRELSEENINLNEKITLQDSKAMQDRESIELNRKKVAALEQKDTDIKRKKENLIQKKDDTKAKLQSVKNEYDRLQREQSELRNHIENMKKLKMYLNKNLDNSLKTLNANVSSKSRLKEPVTDNNDNFWG